MFQADMGGSSPGVIASIAAYLERTLQMWGMQGIRRKVGLDTNIG